MKNLLLLVITSLIILMLIGKIGKSKNPKEATQAAADVLARAVRFFFYGFFALGGAFLAYLLINSLWSAYGA